MLNKQVLKKLLTRVEIRSNISEVFKMFLREGTREGLERLMLLLNYGCTEILGTACSVVRRWSATLQREHAQYFCIFAT